MRQHRARLVLAAALLVTGAALRLPAAVDVVRRDAALNRVNAALLGERDPAAAADALQSDSRQPPDPRLQVHLGRLLTRAGRPAEAVPILAEAVERRPGDDRARLYLGDALYETGAVDAATRTWREAALGQYFVTEAGARLDAEPAAAERLLQKAVALRPADADAQMLYGRLLDRRGELTAALERYEAAYAISKEPDRLVEIGTVLLRMGRHDDARARFMDAAAQRPHVRIYAIHVGDSYRAAGDLDGARTWYARALTSSGPDEALAQRYLGEIELDAGNTERAIAHLTAARGLMPPEAPQQAQAAFGLARALLTTRRAEEAAELLDEALRHDPRNAHYHLVLGEARFLQGQQDEAVREFQAALDYSGGNTGIRDEATRRLAEVGERR